jgi:hypothetical protein
MFEASTLRIRLSCESAMYMFRGWPTLWIDSGRVLRRALPPTDRWGARGPRTVLLSASREFDHSRWQATFDACSSMRRECRRNLSFAESRPENRQARGPLPCGLNTVQFSTPTSTMPNRNSMDPTESNVAAGRVACSRECMLRLANTNIVAKNSSGNSNRVRWITTSSSSARSTKMGGLWRDLRLCASWPTSPSVKLEKEPAYVATPSG